MAVIEKLPQGVKHFTAYSFTDGIYAYLEEDVDLGRLIAMLPELSRRIMNGEIRRVYADDRAEFGYMKWRRLNVSA
jgi:hypothetical protein